MSKLACRLNTRITAIKPEGGGFWICTDHGLNFRTVTNHVASHADVAWEATNHINFWSHFTNHAIR